MTAHKKIGFNSDGDDGIHRSFRSMRNFIDPYGVQSLEESRHTDPAVAHEGSPVIFIKSQNIKI